VGSSRRLLAAFAALAAILVPLSPAQAASPKTLAKFVAASGLGIAVPKQRR